MQIKDRFSGHQSPDRDPAPAHALERKSSPRVNRLALLSAFAVLVMGLPACQQVPPRLATATFVAPVSAGPALAAPLRQPRAVNFAAVPASSDVRFIANWVLDSGDNRQMSFVIIDKKNARVFVFNLAAKLLGSSPVLLGAAKGDDSVPGIGTRPLAQVLPEEKTTPAGRFMGEPGRNTSGEDIVWVEYDAKIAIHRLRPDAARAQRAVRLASAAVDDKRVSFGCIVVPVVFYDSVVRPALGNRPGVVYVLPEAGAVEGLFSALGAS